MSYDEFAEQARLFSAGSISRRMFLNRAVAAGLSFAAASALIGAMAEPAGAKSAGHQYGGKHYPPKPKKH